MKNKNPIQKIIAKYIIALLPLIIYSIYKNGYLPYTKNLINFFKALTPIILPIGSYLTALVIEMFFQLKNGSKNANQAMKESFLPLYALLIACIVNPNINIFLYFGILSLSLILIKFISKIKSITINQVALAKVIYIVVAIVLTTNTYHNAYESSISQSLNNIDFFFGRSIGAMATTNIFLIIVGYIFLCSSNVYKKEIPIYIITGYLTLAVITAIINKDPNLIFSYMFANSILFCAVFIAPETTSSSYTKKGKLLYALLIAVLSFIFITYVSSDNGAFISLLIASVFAKPIDKIFALK